MPQHSPQPSSMRTSRRSIIKSVAGAGTAMALGHAIPESLPVPHAAAQEIDGTRARSWEEAESINTEIKLQGDGWITLQTEFPFWALGFGWDTGVGTWPVVEYGFSYDGHDWEDGYRIDADNDGGPPATDDRFHTQLHFTNGQQYIRYRTIDGEGNLVILDRFQVTYIDPTDGPWEPDRSRMMMRTSLANTDTRVPPTIITRAQWGAKESYRFDSMGEIWPVVYQLVEHAIVHHAAANYGSDGYLAVRSIYYYHAITQGWGDIGYNYVVDVNGNVFEGRVGGTNAVGGHALQFNHGSAGVCVMGDFTYTAPPLASRLALANIVAYVTRDLNPYGTKTFHEILNLPTIVGHRDVNFTTCPGNALYQYLPWLRDTVTSILDSGQLDSQMPGGLVPGDWVVVQTEDETPLPLHAQPGSTQLIVDSIPHGTVIEIERGPISDSEHNWYLVFYNNKQGWVPADFLVLQPLASTPTGDYEFGENIQLKGSVPLRAAPRANAGILAWETNSWAYLMVGPFAAGGADWFQVHTQAGREAWITRDQFDIAPITHPTMQYQPGQVVETVRSTAIRVRPGLPQTVMGTIGAGTRITISTKPLGVTSKTWYGIFAGTGLGAGWVDDNDFAPLPEPISSVGQRFRVTQGLNLRTGSGTGYAIAATLAAGTAGTVIGGPVNSNGYKWWQLRTDGGLQGWAVADWLSATSPGTNPQPTPEPTPPPTGALGIGDTIRIIENLNMRSGASTGYGVVRVLSAGTTGTVLAGPVNASGYTWWQIQTAQGDSGWVVQNWITRTTSAPTPEPSPTPPTETPTPEPTQPVETPEPTPAPPSTGGKFEINDGIRVTEGLNMRSGAGTSFGVVTILPSGTTGTVLAGPQAASGYTWWRIQTSRGTGWVVETWIAKQAAPPPTTGKFTIGDTARVTDNLNMRSGAGTAYGVVAVLPAGTTGTVLDGPRTANGYTWWQVQTGRGTGWAAQDWLAK